MTRTTTRCRYAAQALFVVLCSSIDAAMGASCSPEIVGTWRLPAAAEAEPSLLSFSPEGWVNVLGGSAEHPAGQFEILAQVRYELVPYRDPSSIEFYAARGNDVFPPGKSRWDITAHTDESLTTRRVDSGEQSSWSRVQTHRYFLTFAARNGPGDTAAFVMWTTLDGRKIGREALGVTAQGAEIRFGRISNKLATAFATQVAGTDDVMLRVELNQAEYHRTHQVFEAWNTLLSGDRLARDNPQEQALELLDATVQSLNRCGIGIKTAPTRSTTAMDFVRTLRRGNDRRHVPDNAFPFRWQPVRLSQ